MLMHRQPSRRLPHFRSRGSSRKPAEGLRRLEDTAMLDPCEPCGIPSRRGHQNPINNQAMPPIWLKGSVEIRAKIRWKFSMRTFRCVFGALFGALLDPFYGEQLIASKSTFAQNPFCKRDRIPKVCCVGTQLPHIVFRKISSCKQTRPFTRAYIADRSIYGVRIAQPQSLHCIHCP